MDGWMDGWMDAGTNRSTSIVDQSALDGETSYSNRLSRSAILHDILYSLLYILHLIAQQSLQYGRQTTIFRPRCRYATYHDGDHPCVAEKNTPAIRLALCSVSVQERPA